MIGIHGRETLHLLAEIGLFFLVFEAGLEIHEYTNVSFKKSLKLTLVSGLICFLFGFGLGFLLGRLGFIEKNVLIYQ